MNYSEMPIAACPLSDVERGKLLAYLQMLLQFLGAPGDWGYESKLGQMTIRLTELQSEILRSPHG